MHDLPQPVLLLVAPASGPLLRSLDHVLVRVVLLRGCPHIAGGWIRAPSLLAQLRCQYVTAWRPITLFTPRRVGSNRRLLQWKLEDIGREKLASV